jgi:hypothetical protein
MFKKILLGLAVVIAGLVIFVALQPAEYSVVRSTTISAAPPAVFTQVNDLHNWDAWSPWSKVDPSMRQSFEGPAAGIGAIYTWAGNADVGEGRMTVSESHPSDVVRLKLDFFKPFAGTAISTFTFKPQDSQTVVTWSMSGEKNFLSKGVCLFMSMDKILGAQFEKGLAQMKSVVEASTKKVTSK